MSDPFVHHLSGDIEASTAITPVSDEDLNHAAERAAKQVKAVASGKPSKGGRKAKPQAAELPAPDAVDPVPNLSNAGLERPDAPEDVLPLESGPIIEHVPALVEVAATPEAVSTDSDAIEVFSAEAEAGSADDHSGSMSFAAESLTESASPVAQPDVFIETMPTASDESAEALAAFNRETMASGEADLQAMSNVVQKATEIVEATADEDQTMPATGTVEPSRDLSRAADVIGELRIRVVQSAQANMESSVALWTALLQAKSAAEAIELNAVHLRRQMEAFVSQSLEFSQLARRATTLSMTSLVGFHE